MGAKKLKTYLTDQDLMARWEVTLSWIEQRTGPKARRHPKLPTVPTMNGRRKFDLADIEALESQLQNRSLKTEEAGKDVVDRKTRMKGVYNPLW